MYRNRKSKKHYFFVAVRIAGLFLVLFIIVFSLFEWKARDLVYNLVDNELEIHAMNAIDSAVLDVLSDNPVDYSSIIVSDCDESGKVNALYTDTKAMNNLKAQMSRLITENISNTRKARVGVPAGAFTGIVLISDIGPNIYVSLTMDGSVTTTIKSEFTTAGVNQTMHRVYMVVNANVSLTCPIISHETEFETEYELCQTIIVGNTPQLFASLK